MSSSFNNGVACQRGAKLGRSTRGAGLIGNGRFGAAAAAGATLSAGRPLAETTGAALALGMGGGAASAVADAEAPGGPGTVDSEPSGGRRR